MKAKVSKSYLVVIAVLSAIATTVALTSCHKSGERAKHTAFSSFSATQDAAQAPPKNSGSAMLTQRDRFIREAIDNAGDSAAFGDPSANTEDNEAN